MSEVHYFNKKKSSVYSQEARKVFKKRELRNQVKNFQANNMNRQRYLRNSWE